MDEIMRKHLERGLMSEYEQGKHMGNCAGCVLSVVLAIVACLILSMI